MALSEIPNAHKALASIQSATSMAELCAGFQDLVAALGACAAWTRLALIGARHNWLCDPIAQGDLASFIARQQDLIAFLETIHSIIRQKADLWSATAPETVTIQ